MSRLQLLRPATALRSALILVLVAPFGVRAQDPASYQRGDSLFADDRFSDALPEYRQAVEEDPSHGMSWFRLGMTLQELERWQEAAEAYEEAIGLGTQLPSARLRLARVRTRAGEIAGAFSALDDLADSGFGSVAVLSGQGDFEALLEDDRWLGVLERVRANSEPCLHAEETGQFDFWVGEWDVFSPQGAQIGENHVEQVLLGCALVEHWTNSAGRSGKSLNVYDRGLAEARWRQLYVGDFGGVTDYKDGRWEDGVMHFQARVPGPQGVTLTRHMRFRPVGADTVIQVIEDVNTAGEVTPQFHGIYVRRRPDRDDRPDR